MLVSILIVVEPYRMRRITASWTPGQHELTTNYQSTRPQRARSGGWFGTGWGRTAKWARSRTPTRLHLRDHREELGLIGTLLVLGLSASRYAGLRIARRVKDPFMRLAARARLAGVQAIVNIGAVIKVLPVTGIRCRWSPTAARR